MAKIYCKTKTILGTYDIEWTVDNYTFVQRAIGDWIDSSTFHTGPNFKLQWYLRLFPKGMRADGYISVFLRNPNPSDIVAKFTFSVLNKCKEKYKSLTVESCTIRAGEDYGYPQFLKLEDLLDKSKELLPHNTLTILVELIVPDDTQKHCLHSYKPNIDMLSEDFSQLLKTSNLSDFTIVIGEHKFPVHKAILAARSPVFNAMFQHALEENISNTIHVSDIEPDVMKEVLVHIYSGKSPQIKDMAHELLRVADKYDLVSLKGLCEIVIYGMLTVDNAARTLIVADLYNTKSLKEKTLDFISKNGKEVLSSSAWNDLTEEHPNLEREGLRAVVDRNILCKQSVVSSPKKNLSVIA